MSKRKTEWTEDKITRYFKEGRGQGSGKDYKPWLTIQDFPSQGRVSRLSGWKTGRIHHFMSDLETRFFYLMEWSDIVKDIREQFPLERERTLRIAEEKGIKHPIDTGSQTPIALTSDFLLTIVENGNEIHVVRTIKPSSELDKPRVIEKLEIERAYWEEQGINWDIVTEKEIPKVVAGNIEWVHSSLWLEGMEDIGSHDVILYSELLKSHLMNDDFSIQMITKKLDKEMNVSDGTFLYLLKHLIVKKEILINMDEKFNVQKMPSEQIQSINFDEEKEKNAV